MEALAIASLAFLVLYLLYIGFRRHLTVKSNHPAWGIGPDEVVDVWLCPNCGKHSRFNWNNACNWCFEPQPENATRLSMNYRRYYEQFSQETITKADNAKREALENLPPFEFRITNDEFSGGKIIRFCRIYDLVTDKIRTPAYGEYGYHSFNFGFENVIGEDYLTFQCFNDVSRLQKGDKVSFLFKNGTILDFVLESEPYRVEDQVVNRTRMTTKELNVFQTQPFVKWRLRPSKSGREILGGVDKLESPESVQQTILDMANAYRHCVEKEVSNYKPLETREQQTVRDDDSDRRRISQYVMDRVWRRDGGRCVACGSQENLEFDHIIPFSKGGSNSYRNIQLLCERCNREKSNKLG